MLRHFKGVFEQGELELRQLSQRGSWSRFIERIRVVLHLLSCSRASQLSKLSCACWVTSRRLDANLRAEWAPAGRFERSMNAWEESL